ncbi:MAG: hypothetical protein C5B57_08000 [Blastocatellia bacterium]|nr:MAG: hypothetical protein C5B57_08000 [Blastocatellia bacterium]
MPLLLRHNLLVDTKNARQTCDKGDPQVGWPRTTRRARHHDLRKGENSPDQLRRRGMLVVQTVRVKKSSRRMARSLRRLKM